MHFLELPGSNHQPLSIGELQEAAQGFEEFLLTKYPELARRVRRECFDLFRILNKAASHQTAIDHPKLSGETLARFLNITRHLEAYILQSENPEEEAPE